MSEGMRSFKERDVHESSFSAALLSNSPLFLAFIVVEDGRTRQSYTTMNARLSDLVGSELIALQPIEQEYERFHFIAVLRIQDERYSNLRNLHSLLDKVRGVRIVEVARLLSELTND